MSSAPELKKRVFLIFYDVDYRYQGHRKGDYQVEENHAGVYHDVLGECRIPVSADVDKEKDIWTESQPQVQAAQDRYFEPGQRALKVKSRTHNNHKVVKGKPSKWCTIC